MCYAMIALAPSESFKGNAWNDESGNRKGSSSADLSPRHPRKLPWMNGDCHACLANVSWQQRDRGNQHEEHEPQTLSSLFNLIESCGKKKDLHQARKIHGDAVDRGLLLTNITIGNALISLYVKCGALPAAQDLFEELPARNVVSWNALIAGHTQHGHGGEAIKYYRRMQNEGISPSPVTFVCVLKASGIIKSIEQGQQLHAEISRLGLLEKYQVLGNALVDMYAKCRVLARARLVFDELPVRDVVTWNALISGYIDYGKAEESLSCLNLMRAEGISPNPVTFICTLKACGMMGAAEKGKEIHAEVSRQALLEKDTVLGNALVDMYTKCGALSRAQEVFEGLQRRDVATWNSMITGYVQHGFANEALSCYAQMQEGGFVPDAVTFICILKACGSIKASEKGELVHHDINKLGLLEKDIKVGNALVDMYAKCNALTKARAVCTGLLERNVVTWTALIAGYAEHGFGDKALNCFAQMQQEGHSANNVTFVCVLKACGNAGALEKGEEVHDEIRRLGLLQKEIILGTALMDMYVKCGVLAKAQEVFDMLPRKNVTTWNLLISGYAQNDFGDDAIHWFERMVEEGHSPDSMSFICILKACAGLGAATKGRQMHDEVDRQGVLEDYVNVGNAVVDMYAKCGDLIMAQQVFDKLSLRNAATWTAIVSGYAQVGKVKTAFDYFYKMIEEDIEPSEVTFIVLLNGCSHEGLVEDGELFFGSMRNRHGINPIIEHTTCMVDLFSRVGQFDIAWILIGTVPPCHRPVLLSAFTGACREWANEGLGRWAFAHVAPADQRASLAYVCMANTSATAMLQDEEDIKYCKSKLV